MFSCFNLFLTIVIHCRTTKVEGMLAVTRLATYHPGILASEIHTVIGALIYEVKNLRSTVARSAIYTLGELFVRMRRFVEPVRWMPCRMQSDDAFE